jgi:hypothetical protein
LIEVEYETVSDGCVDLRRKYRREPRKMEKRPKYIPTQKSESF